MQLGHAHRHGRHVRHVRVAAHRLAAVAVVGQQLGLVAHADLAHFDAGAELAGQVLDEVAEIDAFFGKEVEDKPIAAEEEFDVHELHRHVALLDEVAARLNSRISDSRRRSAARVPSRAEADDLPARRLGEKLHGRRA